MEETLKNGSPFSALWSLVGFGSVPFGLGLALEIFKVRGLLRQGSRMEGSGATMAHDSWDPFKGFPPFPFVEPPKGGRCLMDTTVTVKLIKGGTCTWRVLSQASWARPERAHGP